MTTQRADALSLRRGEPPGSRQASSASQNASKNCRIHDLIVLTAKQSRKRRRSIAGTARLDGSGTIGWPLYTWARAEGFRTEAEHIIVHGVPVQFIPAHNALAEEGVTGARTLDYDGVPVRVVDPEHLAALAFQAGGAKRRERAWQLLETGGVDRDQLKALLIAHQIRVDIDDEH